MTIPALHPCTAVASHPSAHAGCGRLPVPCPATAAHPAHDHGPGPGGRTWWHCHGISADSAGHTGNP